MVVRVRVEVRYQDASAQTAALVNSGYGSDVPEVHLPMALARRLNVPLEALRSERYKVVGAEVTAYVLGYVDVRAVTEDKNSPWVRARAVSAVGEYEVLLSDALIEALGIEVLRPRRGLWRFTDDVKLRESVETEYWVE